MDLISIS